MSANDIFEAAIMLRQCHATMRALYGAEQFAKHVADFKPLLELMAKKHDGNVQAAAIHWCNDPEMQENMRPLVLAVAVELKLREAENLCAAGRS